MSPVDLEVALEEKKIGIFGAVTQVLIAQCNIKRAIFSYNNWEGGFKLRFASKKEPNSAIKPRGSWQE